jgi:hypothetical protein
VTAAFHVKYFGPATWINRIGFIPATRRIANRRKCRIQNKKEAAQVKLPPSCPR